MTGCKVRKKWWMNGIFESRAASLKRISILFITIHLSLSLSLSAFLWKWILLIFVYHSVPPSTDCQGEGRAGCGLPRGDTRMRCWCSQIRSTGLHCTGQSGLATVCGRNGNISIIICVYSQIIGTARHFLLLNILYLEGPRCQFGYQACGGLSAILQQALECSEVRSNLSNWLRAHTNDAFDSTLRSVSSWQRPLHPL